MSTEGYETYLTIGQNIRKYRLAKGLSQEKLSEMVCQSKIYRSCWKSRKKYKHEKDYPDCKGFRNRTDWPIQKIGGLIAIKYFS